MLAFYLSTLLLGSGGNPDPGPQVEPVTLAEAKKHLRVETNADNAAVEAAIVDAREWVEGYTGMVLTRRVVTERLAAFADQTKLRAWPIAGDQPVTIVYRDNAGTAQAIGNATLRAATRPGIIYPAAGERWPNRSTISGAIEATFTAGYADPADVPGILKRALLVMLTAFYEDRDGGELFDSSEKAAKALCNRGNYRVRTL